MDGPSAKTIQIIDNNIKTTNIQIRCNEDTFDSIELTRIKSKVTIKMKNQLPVIVVKINSIGHFDEVLCNDEFDKAKTLSNYEKKAEHEINQIIVNGIEKVQQYGGDSFGFGDKYHLLDAKTFNKVADHWNELFVDAKIKVQVNIQIENVGMRKKAYPF
ncbi:hypothetical protein CN601_16945 [Bacillus sp. AFS017336]|nr:hypothetical protein CN692_12165 [Bacillus sp. AFS002410]PEL08406.1 hypothetical protein CN601_16945 [Bacillus sp. AFS017336]